MLWCSNSSLKLHCGEVGMESRRRGGEGSGHGGTCGESSFGSPDVFLNEDCYVPQSFQDPFYSNIFHQNQTQYYYNLTAYLNLAYPIYQDPGYIDSAYRYQPYYQEQASYTQNFFSSSEIEGQVAEGMGEVNFSPQMEAGTSKEWKERRRENEDAGVHDDDVAGDGANGGGEDDDGGASVGGLEGECDKVASAGEGDEVTVTKEDDDTGEGQGAVSKVQTWPRSPRKHYRGYEVEVRDMESGQSKIMRVDDHILEKWPF